MDTRESWAEQRESENRKLTLGESHSIREIFLSAELKQRTDLLRHLVVNSERIVLVRGVHGVGKSTLKASLQQQAPADWQICHIDATPMLHQDQLVYTLCNSFCPQKESLERIEKLLFDLKELKQNGRLPVVIVDDAEQLPVATLIELFQIYSQVSGQTGGLALILIASDLIDVLLEGAQPQDLSRQLQVLELFPLERDQSDQLVRHLLEVLGGKQVRSVSQAELERIFRSSNGLPGKIKQQVQSMLQSEVKSSAAAVKERTVLPHLLADVSPPVLISGVILVLALLLTLVYEDEINAVFETDLTPHGDTDIVLADNKRVVPLILPEQPAKVEREILPQAVKPEAIDLPEQSIPLNEADSAAFPAGPFRAGKPGEAAAVAVELPELPELATPVVAKVTDQPQLSKRPPQKTKGTTVATEAKTNKPEKMASMVKKREEPASLKEPEQAPAASKKRAPVEVPVELPQTLAKIEKKIGSPAPVIELGGLATPATEDAPEPVALKSIKKKPSPAPVHESGIRGESWWLKQSPNSYTLQLIGVGDEQAVADFIKQHRLQGKAAYFRTKRNGRPWFPVLYGVYPSREAAVAARAKIPRNIAGRGIWPRSVASVQQAIRGE